MRVLLVFFTILLMAGFALSQTKSGIELENFDKSVRPQDDFYRYVNGAWLAKTEIPADKSNYGSFTALDDQNQVYLREIIENAARTTSPDGSDRQKVGDFYASFMDTIRIEELGIQPLQKEIERIQSIQSLDQLDDLLARLYAIGAQIPVATYVTQDAKQSDRYITYLTQSGLGLPDKDYYFKPEENFQNIRNEYVNYVEKLLALAKQPQARVSAEMILKLETEIAQAHWTRVQNRDRDKTYNKFEVVKLQELAPEFNWTDFMKKAGLPKEKEVIVRQPDFLTAFGKLFKQYSLDDWKAYLTYKLINSYADYLSSDFVNLKFNFYGKTLTGTEQNEARWKRGVQTVDGALGEVVGKIYVEKYFKPEAKARMLKLVDNLVASYKDRIKQVSWMSDATKRQALVKLNKFNAKIGYPDKWKDYSSLSVKRDELVDNVMRSNLFDYKFNIGKLGKLIDRTEWFMTPQTVNAYYNPSMNEVVFPAAILQPPFFNMEADDAVNYGAIGAVIGHELTHGFDDQGSKSDGDGNLRNWWTDDDRTNFNGRTQLLVNQYGNYAAIDTMKLNGNLTLGENIADLGGLTISYYAYKKALNGKTAPTIDGFTGDQRFFIGWSQVWRRKYRDDELRRRVLTDPHSPSEFRANGAVSNMPEFYSAFEVDNNDKLYRNEDARAMIW